jgi:hypothetical protein
MPELDQMLRCDAGPVFLIDVDSGAFVPQIGINCDDWYIAADVLQIAQINAQGQVEQNTANLVSTEFVHGASDLGSALIDDTAEHEA